MSESTDAPLYRSKPMVRSLWHEYRLYADRLELDTFPWGTVCVPLADLKAVTIRPPMVIFDVYRGESIPQGTRSLAFALTYQAPDRTLTDKEVDNAHGKIEDRLKHVLKAQVRGK